MPRGATRTARQKAQDELDKANARWGKLHAKQANLAEALRKVEAEINELSRLITHLKQHPALHGTTDDAQPVDEITPSEHVGEVPAGHPEPTPLHEEDEREEALMVHPTHGTVEPAAERQPVDPRDPVEQTPVPPKTQPDAPKLDSRGFIVAADPFAD
jgi:hypothetical protein